MKVAFPVICGMKVSCILNTHECDKLHGTVKDSLRQNNIRSCTYLALDMTIEGNCIFWKHSGTGSKAYVAKLQHNLRLSTLTLSHYLKKFSFTSMTGKTIYWLDHKIA